MNRHSKFYDEIRDYMEDDYYDDDDEYYEEMEGDHYNEDDNCHKEKEEDHYDENDDHYEGGANGTALPGAVLLHQTTIYQKDVDFEVSDKVVESLREGENGVGQDLAIFTARQQAAERVNTSANNEKNTTDSGLSEEGKKNASGAGGARAGGTSGGCPSPASEPAPPAPKNAVAQRGKAVAPLATSQADCTVVVAGHVDAGKSTTLGHLLLLLGAVEAARGEAVPFAWLLDHSEEERRRGVTVDAAAVDLNTAHRRVHLLDAPGHKDFVLNMVSSATQADAAMLVVPAALSEFEDGLSHGTREHLLVLKTLGVNRILVVVNKMDMVGFSQARYEEIVREMNSLFKQLRFAQERVLGYCPVSGIQGTNLVAADPEALPWYTGPTLVEWLDSCPLENRLLDAPLRLSLQDVQKDTLYVKVESGKLSRGDVLRFSPCEIVVNVKSIRKPPPGGGSVSVAFCGETVEIHTQSALIGVYPGCIGYLKKAPSMEAAGEGVSTDFEAHIQTFPTLTRSVLPGAIFTLVMHAVVATVRVVALVAKMDTDNGEWSKGMVKCVPPKSQALVIFRADQPIALVPAEECRALGRFALQQDGNVVGGGFVKKFIL